MRRKPSPTALDRFREAGQIEARRRRSDPDPRMTPGTALALWRWNARPENTDVRRQVREMATAGFSGLIVQADPAAGSQFLTDSWLDALEWAVDEARRAGMELWLHDGSGPNLPLLRPGRKLPTRSRLRAQAIRQNPENAPFQPGRNTVAVYSALLRDGQPVQIHRLKLPAPEIALPGPAPDLQEKLEQQIEPAPDPREEVVMLHLYTEPSPGLDPEDPMAIRAWMDSVHELLYREFGEEFSATITGLFTVLPPYACPPWSPALATLIQESYGRDPTELLPGLFFDVAGDPTPSEPDSEPDSPSSGPTFESGSEPGPEGVSENAAESGNDPGGDRYDYWRAVNEAYRRGIQSLQTWCANRDLVWSALTPAGLTPSGGTLESQLYSTGGDPGVMSGMTAPAALFDGSAESRELQLAVSAARHSWRGGQKRFQPRCLALISPSESGESPARLTWIAACALAEGAGILALGPMFYSLRTLSQERQGAILLAPPWKQEWPLVMSAIARLRHVAQIGLPVSEALLISPVSSAWLGFSLLTSESLRLLEEGVQAAESALRKAGIPFDIGDEGLLTTQATIEGDRLRVGAILYRIVVIPPVTTLSAGMVTLLEKWMAAGGKVIFIGEMPGRMDGRPSPRPASLAAEALRAQDPGELSDLLEQQLAGFPASRSVQILSGPGARFQFRDDGARQFALLANRSFTESTQIRLFLSGQGQLESWNAFTGESVPLASDSDTLNTRIEVHLGPGEFQVVALDTSRPPEAVPPPEVRQELVSLRSEWDLALNSPNVLSLVNAEFKIGNADWVAGESLSAIQERIRSAPAGLPVHLRFRLFVEPGVSRRQLFLVVDPAAGWVLTLNGEPLPDRDEGWWLDPGKRKVAVGSRLRDGINILLLADRRFSGSDGSSPCIGNSGSGARGPGVAGPAEAPIVEPVFLLGEFATASVRNSGDGARDPGVMDGSGAPHIAPLPRQVEGQDLERVGLSGISGPLELRQAFTVPLALPPWKRAGSGQRMALEVRTEQVASICAELNGKRVGTALGSRLQFDVTFALKKGKNLLSLLVTPCGGHLFEQGEPEPRTGGMGVLSATLIMFERT